MSDEEPARQHRVRVLGGKGPPEKFKCGGWTGCEVDHEFYAPENVVIMSDAIPVEVGRDPEHGWTQEAEDNAVRNRCIFIHREYMFPTLLGEWWESTAVN